MFFVIFTVSEVTTVSSHVYTHHWHLRRQNNVETLFNNAILPAGLIHVVFLFSFGSKLRSSTSGIVFNNQMDDFSTPNLINVYGLKPTPANFIKPGKRPQSSACPTIVLNNKGNVTLIVGASGGARIISAVSEVGLLIPYNVKET